MYFFEIYLTGRCFEHSNMPLLYNRKRDWITLNWTRNSKIVRTSGSRVVFVIAKNNTCMLQLLHVAHMLLLVQAKDFSFNISLHALKTYYKLYSPTSMVNPMVCQCRNLCCLNFVQLSLCRMDTARLYSHFLVIQLKVHIFLWHFVHEQFLLHMNQQILLAVMTCTSTFAHINRLVISRMKTKAVTKSEKKTLSDSISLSHANQTCQRQCIRCDFYTFQFFFLWYLYSDLPIVSDH